MSKDFTTMTVEEAVQVCLDKYKFKDVRRRIQSKAVAWVLCQALGEAAHYTERLETKIKELEKQNELSTKV